MNRPFVQQHAHDAVFSADQRPAGGPEADLAALAGRLKGEKLNGKTAPRLILVSPIAHEQLPGKLWPDAAPPQDFDAELFKAYMRFNEEMHQAGVLVASEGLNPAARGAREAEGRLWVSVGDERHRGIRRCC